MSQKWYTGEIAGKLQPTPFGGSIQTMPTPCAVLMNLDANGNPTTVADVTVMPNITNPATS